MRKNKTGFTLVEAMVSLAIIASAVITVPPLVKWIRHQGVGHAADQLRNDLQLARMMAINRKQSCAIILDTPDLDQYRNSLDQSVAYLDAFRGGVRFVDPGPDGTPLSSRVVFNRQGMSKQAPPVNLFLADQDGSAIYRIRVVKPGGISVHRWGGNQWN